MIQLSVEGLPSEFDCDMEFNTTDSRTGKFKSFFCTDELLCSISPYCILSLVGTFVLCTCTDFSDDILLNCEALEDDEPYYVTGKIIAHLFSLVYYILCTSITKSKS